MRISTSQLFSQGLKRMQEQNTTLSELQTQIATGEKLLRPSDDPAGSVRLLGLERVESELNQYQENITLVSQRLEGEDVALRGVTKLLLRVRQLTLQANTPTNTESDRTSIKNEIDLIYDELLGFANQKDGRGNYLFAGFKGGTQPFQSNGFGDFESVSYHGDPAQRFVQISETRQIADSDSGSSIFTRVESDKAVRVSEGSPNSGLAEVSQPFLLNPNPFEIVTLQFDSNTVSLSSAPAGVGIVAGDSDGAGDTIKLGDLTYQYVTDKSYASTGNVAVVVANTNTSKQALEALENAINGESSSKRSKVNVHSSDTSVANGKLLLQSTKEGANAIATEGSILESDINNGALTSSIVQNNPSKDPYSITFDNPASTFTITNDVTSISQIITYTPGSKYEVDGMEFSVKGAPAVGDKFNITATKFQDTFSTFNRLKSILGYEGGSDTVKAGLGQTLVDLDAMLEKTYQFQATVGGRLNTLDSQRLANDEYKFEVQKTHSAIGDVDIVEAVSKLQLEQITLQAAQQTFIKLQNLSLFNFIN